MTWPESFTAEEVSAVLSCLSNHHSMCCDQTWRIDSVVRGQRKREVLFDWAYDNWGCESGGLLGPTRAERYFELALETVTEFWKP